MGKTHFGRDVNVTVRNDRGGQHGGGGYRKQNYNQHDDRDAAGPSINSGQQRRGSMNRTWTRGGGSGSRGRHVSFNDRGGGGGGGGGARGGGIQKRNSRGRGGGGGGIRTDIILDDSDSRMEGRGPNAGRARPIYGGRGKPRRGRGGRGVYVSGGGVIIRRGGQDDPAGGWHKVILLNASRYTKEEVLTALVRAHAAVAPLAFVKQGMNYVFYVETRQQAAALTALDKAVTLADGSTLNIRADPSASPQATMTDEAEDKIKTVMSDRFNPQTKALDLKAFHADRAFLGEAVFTPLYRGICMKRVVKIVEENIPQIEAVDLSDNRLNMLDSFAPIIDKAKNIKILFLANNKIQDIKELLCLREMKLEVLKVEGNPFVNRYVDRDHLVRNVRKIFPNLKVLDDKELPKVIGFEGDDDDASTSGTSGLPPVHMKMTCNASVEPIILQFLQEYFKVYDSGKREPLMNAYHEEALMSLSCAYPPWKVEKTTGQHLSEYYTRSRNLTRILDPTRRRALLRQGRLSVVSFLNELPKSSHDFASFSLDVILATEAVMQFTVTGVFREILEEASSSAPPVIRHFNRTFVVVPQGGGFCIVNETLYVSCASPNQVAKAFTGQPPVTSPTPAASATVTSQTPDANTMKSMVEAMSLKSGMNAEWSKKCLETTNWNFDEAMAAFKTASNEGKIPIEAYEK